MNKIEDVMQKVRSAIGSLGRYFVFLKPSFLKVSIAAGIFFALIIGLVFTTHSSCEFTVLENATATGESVCTTTTFTGMNFWLQLPLAAIISYIFAALCVFIINKCCNKSYFKDA